MNICPKHNEEKVLWAKKWKCKSCNREYQKKWFADNKDTQRTRTRINTEVYVKRNQDWVFSYLKENPCITCGCDDLILLEFDHRDPSTKINTVSSLIRSGCSLEKVQTEVAKCDVLCIVCHRRKTAKQFGWRKLEF